MPEQTTQSRSLPRRRLAAVACVAMLATLALPGIASAKPHGHVTRNVDVNVDIETRGSHGYTIDLFSVGQRVALLALNDPFNVLYDVHGHVTRNRVTANFGKLGRISMRFKATSRETVVLGDRAGKCPPPRIIREFGIFRGVFVFRGEQGFTRASKRRLHGEMTRSISPNCPDRQARASSSPKRAAGAGGGRVAALVAGARSHGRVISFAAAKAEAKSPEWVFAATLNERLGRVAIERETSVEFESSGTVELTKQGVHPASADVLPPPPFTGTAHFAEEPVPPALAWDGSLSVPFAGVGPVSLAGSGFRAFLCDAKNLEAVFDCLFEAAESEPPSAVARRLRLG